MRRRSTVSRIAADIIATLPDGHTYGITNDAHPPIAVAIIIIASISVYRRVDLQQPAETRPPPAIPHRHTQLQLQPIILYCWYQCLYFHSAGGRPTLKQVQVQEPR